MMKIFGFQHESLSTTTHKARSTKHDTEALPGLGAGGVSICDKTARAWLLELGFTRKNHHKTVYFDGHERQDVVEYREDKMLLLDDRCIYPGHTPELLPGESH